MSAEWTRRSALLGAVGAALAFAQPVRARLRTPVGGKMQFRLPWSLAEVDPHDRSSLAAALFGDALFDTLYSPGASGPLPSLAEGPPESGEKPGTLEITLREGLRTGRGESITVKEVVASLTRARASGADGWLSPLGIPSAKGSKLIFTTTATPARAMEILSSRLLSIVPRNFSPKIADGTGAFMSEVAGNTRRFLRSDSASNGPALLDSILVHEATDLVSSLRSFESKVDDLGWLGGGLYEPRANSEAFDAGSIAWVVLRIGKKAPLWDAPGVAQKVCDGLSPQLFSPLALGGSWKQEKEEPWPFAPAELLVRDDSAWMLEVAKTFANALSHAGHELTSRALSPRDFRSQMSDRTFMLALDVVRPFAASPLGELIALTQLDSPERAKELARKPPATITGTARQWMRERRSGILGEVVVRGAVSKDFQLAKQVRGWDLSRTSRRRAG